MYDRDRLKRVFHEALDYGEDDLPAFLDRACEGDTALRAEVLRLIAASRNAGSFLEIPIAAAMASASDDSAEPPWLASGTLLGPYRIDALLGRGGMGEVYSAFDSRLGRQVAVKVLPARAADDQAQLRRFEQEARSAGALNHPNIVTVYDVGRVPISEAVPPSLAGTPFLVTELLNGHTVGDLLAAREPLPPTLAVEYVRQVVTGLAAAHDAGVVHRDIKPHNLFLTSDGRVKILDFGVAKLMRHQGQLGDASGGTLLGSMIGTVGYMAPEQVRGVDVDHRADLFAVGAILYEMLAGRRAFCCDTDADTIAAVLHRDPPIPARWEKSHPTLTAIVRRCLEKDPDKRFQTASELLTALQRVQGSNRTPLVANIVASSIRRPAMPVALAVAVIATVIYYLAGRVEAISSIAILPFANAGADSDAEYLSDGITESTINSLSRLPDLKVIARSSVFQYKGKKIDPQMAARELGVRVVLIGEIVRRSGNLRVSAELVDALDKSRIWGEQYNRDAAEILQVQEEIAEDISDNLRLKLRGEERKRLTRRPTRSNDAYDLYLRGRYHYIKGTEEGLRKAAQSFQRAIDVDQSYARAYAGLADAYNALGQLSFIPVQEAITKSRAATMKALELDDTLAEAHASLGRLKEVHDWDFAGAERALQRAIELNANYANAHRWYAFLLSDLGRHQDAIAEIKQAQALDPLSTQIRADLAVRYYNARQYDLAIEQLRATIEMQPDDGYAHLYLGAAYLEKKMYSEAVAEVQAAIQLSGQKELLGLIGYAHAVAGKRGEALKILAELKRMSSRNDVVIDPNLIATVYIGLGEKDKAFEWLNKAVEYRSGDMVGLKVNPLYDTLRSDPRFEQLIRRVGLPL